MEDQQKLYLTHQRIVLPHSIDHETYAYVFEALLEAEGKPLRVYCNGNGGSTSDAFAIVDLLREYGKISGVLAGEARSCHSIIFMGCPERYVYPMAALAVHKAAQEMNHYADTRSSKNVLDELAHIDDQIAEIYASASDSAFNKSFWKSTLERAGSDFFIHYYADELIEMGIAKPIVDFVESKKPVTMKSAKITEKNS